MDRRIIVTLACGGLSLALLSLAVAEEPQHAKTDDAKPSLPVVVPSKAKAGAAAFEDVARVLQHPRCMNCHPTGDRPLQTDASTPHKMNVSRTSEANGLACSTCHQTKNSEELGIAGGPPGAPNWHLPPDGTPMIFQGRTAAELCLQLKTPEHNGGKTLAQLLHHVSEDPLVLWGWNPGGDRTKPPLSHKEFVAAFSTWVDSGGACP